MGQVRLNHLTLVSLGSNLVSKKDFSDLLKEFSEKTNKKTIEKYPSFQSSCQTKLIRVSYTKTI